MRTRGDRPWPGRLDESEDTWLVFVKTRLDQCLEFFHRLIGIRAFTTDVQLRSLAGSQHHQSHDALAIYLFAFLRHPDFRAVTTRNPHEHGRGSCMESQSVSDREIFFNLPNTLCATSLSIQQSHYTAPFPATPEVAAAIEGGRSIKRSNLALKSTALF